MENKQTAIEWFVNMLDIDKNDSSTKDVIEQAKEMFEEHMCEFANNYVLTQCNASFEGNVAAELSAEEYYELTFKSE